MKTKFKQLKKLQSSIIELLKKQEYQSIIKEELKFDIETLDDSMLLYLFGTNRLALNDLILAEKYLKKSIKINNNSAHAVANLGMVYDKQEKFDEAHECYINSIEIDPKHFEGQYNLAVSYTKKNDNENAIKHFEIALELNKNVRVLNKLAQTYADTEQYENALKMNSMSLELNADDIETLNKKGMILISLERFKEAVELFKKLIKISPKLCELHFNLGVAYRGLDEVDEEIKCYETALKINPNNPEANYNLGLYLLRNKKFKEGWKKYEYRMDTTLIDNVKRPNTNLPFWTPKEQNSRLFVWPEQGVGDCIFFASVLPELKEKCQSLTCAVDERLVDLFKRSMPEIKFVSRDSTVFSNQFDHQLAIGSIPQFFRNEEKDFENTPISYLKADLEKSLKLEKEIENTGKFTIGICWKSKTTVEKRKNIDLINLMNSLKIPAKFVSLQYGDVEQEILEVKEKTGIDIDQCKSLDIFNDLDGLASLMCACDIVVTIPNVNQTIASALGIPTFLLVSNNPTFRWFTEGMDTMWHPNTKVFRQTKDGDWNKPIQEMSKVIINLIMQLYQKQA